LRIAPN
jgi:site-specific DNA recombinase